MNTGISRINLLAAAALAILFAAAIAPTGLDAQRQGSRARAVTGAAPVERAIRLANELELTADQRTQLEGMRTELLEQRTARAAALMALRSEVAAGIREPEAMRQALTEQWRGGADARESLRDRFSEILTEDQREELQRMNRRTIARQRGPANRGRSDRQRGPRGTRPFDRGRRPSRSRGDRP
ncbi:MAG: Spy/CpxP family protein refolding chaperone [Gemmatimonadota bacterium]|nr:Spy/CpxP family protein refolding chaperone [Gemmatimonadota bacterium]